MNTTSSNTTFFTVNRTNVEKIDPKRDSICISIEEFEDLMECKRICKTLYETHKELLKIEKEAEE